MTMVRYVSFWNTILTALGLNCLEQKFDWSENQCSYGISKRRLTIPIILICTLSYLTYFIATRLTHSSGNIGFTLVSAYLELSGTVVAILTIFLSLINSNAYANLKWGFDYFSQIYQIDNKKVLLGAIKYCLVSLSLFSVSFVTDFMVTRRMPKDVAHMNLISSSVFQIYNFFNICQFAICLFWIRSSFKILNDDLALHLKKAVHTVKQAAFEDVVNDTIPEYLRSNGLIIKCIQVHRGNAFERILKVRQVYHASYVQTIKTDEVFASRNLLTVGHNFVLGTIYTYFGISDLVQFTSGSGQITSIELIYDFKWAFICFASIFGLIWPSTSICNEVKKAMVIIQDTLTKEIKKDTRLGLEMFATQLNQEQVFFSPHGFFKLNNTLLLSVIGAVVSYLVILIQFRISTG